MNARVLAFPVAVAAIAALDGCQGTAMTDPSVRQCHDDTVRAIGITDRGDTVLFTTVFRDDPTKCRKAAQQERRKKDDPRRREARDGLVGQLGCTYRENSDG